MTPDREPFSQRDASDAMLDELMAQARWPEPDAGAQGRLKDAYLRIPIGRDSKVIRTLLAIAAMLVIASGVWIALSLRRSTPPTVAKLPAPANPLPTPPASVARHAPLVRELRPVERLALITDKRRPTLQRQTQTSGRSSSAPIVDPLAGLQQLNNAALMRLATQTGDSTRRDRAISTLLQRNDLQSYLYFVLRDDTRDDALNILKQMPDPPIRALLAELDHQQVDYRLAAAKALGGLCDHHQTHGIVGSTLMSMVQQNDHRREAIAALLSCSDPHAKQFLSQAQAYASADEIRSVQRDLNKTF